MSIVVVVDRGVGDATASGEVRDTLMALARHDFDGRVEVLLRAGHEPGRPRAGGFEIGLGEWALVPEARAIRPGSVTFVIRNRGKFVHGFELEITRRATMTTTGSRPSRWSSSPARRRGSR